jgi:Gluconate 2-dehydrogenase subunit 3
MNRRDLIKHIALLTGAAVAGGEFFLSGCKSNDAAAADFFTRQDISFFDEVAETILPKTNTPGAKEAEVGKFMASYAKDCYDELQRKTLKDGIGKLNEASEKMNKVSFMEATAPQKQTLLTEIDAEAKKYNENNKGQTGKDNPPHYFTLMKQLVLFGFFTSKPGVTQVLRYMPVPGKYEGCIDYKEGDTSWA